MNRILLSLICWTTLLTAAACEDLFELPPIEYSQTQPGNRISMLATALERGETTLAFDARFGYLPALLKSLQISDQTQMLVFSKTSLQRHRISPRTPRAIYFNDDTYVGYCHAGDVIEISATDPRLGTVFYTLDQTEARIPEFQRKTHNCLVCHAGSRTDNLPGHVIRSVFTDTAGLPILSEGGQRVDHTTPLEKRWGGWYVTGTHGDQLHLGNFIVEDQQAARPWKNSNGLNVTEVDRRVTGRNYLTPHSDLVALMVFEHQTLVHNLITNASFTTRQALHYERSLNKALGEPEDRRLESTTRRIQNAGEKLVEGLLMFNEAALSSRVSGTSGFTAEFQQQEPQDEQGRSLRQLDLQTRLFRYPCSYLIYSPEFQELPAEMHTWVRHRLVEVLAGAGGPKFAYLTQEDRDAIASILKSTLPEIFSTEAPAVP